MALTKEAIVGLDIGGEQVSFAQVDIRGNGSVRLTNAGWMPLMHDANSLAIAAAIKELWRDSHLSSLTVASCLRSRLASVRHFRFPSLSEDELVSALTLESEEMLQLDAAEIAFDWHENHVEANAADARGREGVLVAVPRAELMEHQSTLESAGLLPVVVDVGCMALGNAYLGVRRNESREDAVCLVNLECRSADIAILYHRNAMYPRCLTNMPEGELGIRFLADSIIDLLKYYQFKLRREPVERIVITGRAEDMESYCKTIEKRVGLPATPWDPCRDVAYRSARVKQVLDRQPSQGVSLTTAIGMAMRS